jgi:hypothetical protein
MTVGVLVYFHCPSNTGYAIERLEKVFYRMAQRLAGSDSAIFFAYVNLDAGMPKALPQAIGGVFWPRSASWCKKTASAWSSGLINNRACPCTAPFAKAAFTPSLRIGEPR